MSDSDKNNVILQLLCAALFRRLSPPFLDFSDPDLPDAFGCYRLLQEGERRKDAEVRRRELEDEVVARALLTAEEKELAEQRRREEIERRVDVAMEMKKRADSSASRAEQIAADEALARQLAQEFGPGADPVAEQIYDDAQYAAWMSAQARAEPRAVLPSKPRVLLREEMNHLRDIHSKFCTCPQAGRGAVPLKHLVLAHIYYCKCNLVHRHGQDCCVINHFHNERCHCSFFD